MRTYKPYYFRVKDPAIGVLKEVIVDKQGGGRLRLSEIEEAGGPSTSAMRSWFWGKTRRPQNCTIEAAGRAVGMRRVWVPDKKRRNR